jgi:allantoicase
MVRPLRRDKPRISLRRNIGNEAPEVSVEALFAADGEADPLPDDERVWILISEHVGSF